MPINVIFFFCILIFLICILIDNRWVISIFWKKLHNLISQKLNLSRYFLNWISRWAPYGKFYPLWFSERVGPGVWRVTKKKSIKILTCPKKNNKDVGGRRPKDILITHCTQTSMWWLRHSKLLMVVTMLTVTVIL